MIQDNTSLKIKTLIISETVPPIVQGPAVMLRNWLRHFPPGSYCILSKEINWRGTMDETSRLPCSHYFVPRPYVNNKNRYLRTFSMLFEQMWIAIIVFKGLQIVKKEKITNLMVIPDQGPLLIAAYFIHWLSGLPLHIHMTDFWEEMLFDRLRKFVAKIFEKRILKSATKMSVINEYMQNYYFKKHNVRAELIPNSVILKDYKNSTPIVLNTDGDKTIVYTGNVWIPQTSSLADMCTVVNSLEGVKFIVYTDRSSTELEQKNIHGKNVIVKFAKPSQIPSIQKAADILYLPLAFEAPFPMYIDSVSPSKMPEYMAAGKPILVYAPETTYVAKFAKEKYFAYVVTERSLDNLRKALHTLLNDKAVREGIVKNSKMLVKKFDTALISHKIQEILKGQVVS